MTLHPGTRAGGLLGIDLGTASVKAVVTDHDGAVVGHAGQDYAVSHPHPGWAESDPYDWLRAAGTAVRAAVAAAAVRPTAIGLSGQMHGLVLADEHGVPLRPAMLWSDSRATREVGLYRALSDDVRARLGNPLVPGMAGPMLAWLGRHEAGHLRRARWALQAKDWLRLQLTGEVHTEPSDASATLLYDLTTETWDRDVIDAIGADPRILPDLLPSSFAPAGRLTPESAALLDVPTGTPVAAGAADTAAALLGTGLAAPGSVQLTIGTGIQVVSPFEELAAGLSSTPVTHTYRTAHPSGWYAMAAMLNGGSTLAWVRQILGLSWSELYDCAGLPPAVDDPTFLPHLHGERTPWLDTSLRGSWTDLNPRHDRRRLARAALEGVAITVKTGFECLHPPSTVSTRSSVPVRLAGGGTVSPAWRQMLADAIGRPLEAVEANAASGRGAALLGGVSAEEIPRLPPRTAPGERVATPSRRGVDLFDARAALARERLRSLSRSP